MKKKTARRAVKKKVEKKVVRKTLKKPTKKKFAGKEIKKAAGEIKSIIAEVLEVDSKKITPKAKFVEDLGMDSMRALEILAAIEKRYKIEIPEESLTQITSFEEVIKLTKELLEKKYGHR